MKSVFRLNKKGAEPQSILITIASLVIIGIILVLFSNLFSNIYGEIDEQFTEKERFNQTEAHLAITEIQTVENTAWDFAFLGIAIGYIIILGFTAFATRITPFFFWIYIIISIIGLFVAAVLSNVWQEMASNPELTSTIARFPITNTLLGTYYPIFITALLAIVIVLLFGKPFSGGAQ